MQRNYSFFTFISFLLGLSILMTACRQDDRLPITPNSSVEEIEPGEDVILGEKTHFLRESSRDLLVSVSLDQQTLTFSKPQSDINQVQAGEILMIAPTLAAPYGLLRKVTKVTRSGDQIEFETEQASLDEAIESGHLTFDRELRPEDILIEELAEGFTRIDSTGRITGDGFQFQVEKEIPLDNGEVFILSGEFSLQPRFRGDIDFGFFSIETAEIVVELEHEADLSGVLGIPILEFEKDIPIGRYVFAPFMAGPVPVTPIVTLSLEVSGSAVVGIAFSVDYEAQIEAGLRYENDNWSGIWERQLSGGTDFGPTASMECQVGLDPGFGLLLFGVAGPTIEAVELYAKLEADPFDAPCWTAEVGAQIDYEVNFEIFGYEYELVDDIEFPPYEWTIADGPCLNPGTLSGAVVEALNTSPLEGVSVDVFRGSSIVASGITDNDGRYEMDVPAGSDMRIRYSKEGYIEAWYNELEIEPFLPTYINRILSVDEAYDGQGAFGGYITDALTGQGLAGVTLSIREGYHNSFGSILATTTSLSDGSYSFSNIQAGNYTVEAQLEGYITGYFDAVCLGNQTTGFQNGSITPELAGNEIRIVLTWGATPSDLDSHLTGPMENGSRFHVYWLSQYPYGAGANLDVDDVSSYGPETVTILEQRDGVYRYSVHDFTNLSSTSSTALGYSGARVKVFFGSAEIADISVPNQPGTLWTVFEMDGTTFTPINEMSYESDYNGIRSETNDAYLLQRLPRKQ